MKIHRILAVCFTVIATGACTKSSKNILASYVSPVQYESYSCAQIAAEMQRVSQRAAQVAGVQDSRANKDAVAMGVGLVVFWPALFFLSGGSDENAAELGRLKGTLETLEQVGIQKNCGIKIDRPEPQQAKPRQDRPHYMDGAG